MYLNLGEDWLLNANMDSVICIWVSTLALLCSNLNFSLLGWASLWTVWATNQFYCWGWALLILDWTWANDDFLNGLSYVPNLQPTLKSRHKLLLEKASGMGGRQRPKRKIPTNFHKVIFVVPLGNPINGGVISF